VCHECLDPLFNGIKALAGLVAAIEFLAQHNRRGSYEKPKKYRPTALRTDNHISRLDVLEHSAGSSSGAGSTGSNSGEGHRTRPARQFQEPRPTVVLRSLVVKAARGLTSTR
jgi:hypothetical protein